MSADLDKLRAELAAMTAERDAYRETLERIWRAETMDEAQRPAIDVLGKFDA